MTLSVGLFEFPNNPRPDGVAPLFVRLHVVRPLSVSQHLVEVDTGDGDVPKCPATDKRPPPRTGSTLPAPAVGARIDDGDDCADVARSGGYTCGSRGSGSSGCCCRGGRDPLSAANARSSSPEIEHGNVGRRSDQGQQNSEGSVAPAQACDEGEGRSCRCVVTYEGEITGLASQVRRV